VQGHWLAAIGAEVDDREAAMGQSQSAVRADPFSRGVRAAAVHSSRNDGKSLAIYRRRTASICEICCNSAHYAPTGYPSRTRMVISSVGNLVGEKKLNSYQFVVGVKSGHPAIVTFC
jgi:hypothetical protein